MPRNNTTNGNGKNSVPSSVEELQGDKSAATTASQPPQFQLHADATIGEMLTASDESYAALLAEMKRARAIKIKQRAREVANLLNPYLQQQEIMIEAQRIVEEETAGLPQTGHTLPTIGLLGGGY